MSGSARDERLLLDVRGVSAGYDLHNVLHGVSLQLAPGELVGLAGPNGSGKSTLLHCITGYHRISGGDVTIAGDPITSLTRRTIAERIAFVPQHTECVYSYSALEMVLMGRHPFAGLAAVDSTADVNLAVAALGRLEVAHLADRKYWELSGGEKQLVLLARAFAQGTPVLILDEPLTGLDIRHQFQLMSALRRAAGDPDHGVLATFHDLAVAARWCTRIILLRDGQVLASGAPAEVITPANLAALYHISAQVSTDASGHLSIQVTGYCETGEQ